MAASSATSSGRAERVLVAASVLLAVLMVILDMTVVNIALPHMMGALGATPDQVTWVLTSYIVAEAVVIPASGFLAARFGRKNVMLWSVSGFVLASVLCGQATSLLQMVIFRLLQGAFGASVIPLSQATMIDTFDDASRPKAMALWGIGILVGPVMGPTVGGFITDHLGWRWVFYINLPIGLINLAAMAAFLKPTAQSKVSADWLGALLLALGVGSLQMLLDRGNGEDWLQSGLIVTLAVVSIICLAGFSARSFTRSNSIIHLELLRDRNLALATLLMMAFSVGMLSTIALQPLFLEHLLGYPAETAGLVMAPRGFAVAMGMVFVAIMVNKVQPRSLVLAGLVLASLGSYAMTLYTLDVDNFWIIAPGIVQGLGMGMIFVPLSTLAYQTMSKAHTDEAAGVFNLFRTIGGSIGIAIAATVLTRQTQKSGSILAANINPYNPNLETWLNHAGLTTDNPLSLHVVAAELTRQATMIGFIDAFAYVAISFVILLPLALLLPSVSRRRESESLPQPQAA